MRSTLSVSKQNKKAKKLSYKLNKRTSHSVSKQAEAITSTIFELFCSFLLLHTHNLNFFSSLLQLSIINSETKGQRERERERDAIVEEFFRMD